MWRIVLCAGVVWAVSAADGPRFETASIQPNRSGDRLYSMRVQILPGPITVTIHNATLKFCVQQAYSVKEYQVGGPGWIDKARYNIVAVLPTGAAPGEVGPALQTLLTERLKLSVRREEKDMAIYALTVGANGPNLRPAIGRDVQGTGRPASREGSTSLQVDNFSIDKFCEDLSRYADRPVLDATGLPGTFDFELQLEGRWKVRGASISNALERKFGLKTGAEEGIPRYSGHRECSSHSGCPLTSARRGKFR